MAELKSKGKVYAHPLIDASGSMESIGEVGGSMGVTFDTSRTYTTNNLGSTIKISNWFVDGVECYHDF